MSRKDARAYLRSTLRSLVPDRVIDDLWDRVVAPLYDLGRVSDTVGHPDTASEDTVGHPDTASEDTRTPLDVLQTYGWLSACDRCPLGGVCDRCYQRVKEGVVP